MEFSDYTSLFSLFVAIAAIIVSVRTWHKNRVVYEIVTETDSAGISKINEMLKKGNYAILHVQPHPSNSFKMIYILGRVSN